MRLHHLSLTNFRNYTRLELSLPARLNVFQGANAQGKTNLLEAIHLLATARSPRAAAERELINWLALEGPLPYARLTAEIGDGPMADWPAGRRVDRLELVLELSTNGGGLGPLVRKQVRINGVARRGLDLIGRLRVVLFLPEDVSLVAGAPGERRRYLDIALCQIDHAYCRALTEYNKVLAQRNALLKRLRDEGGDAGQLTFWDEQMAGHGALVLGRRARAVSSLDDLARTRHRELSGGSEWLALYLPAQSRRSPRWPPGGRMQRTAWSTPNCLSNGRRNHWPRTCGRSAAAISRRARRYRVPTVTIWLSWLTAATCAPTVRAGSRGPRCWP